MCGIAGMLALDGGALEPSAVDRMGCSIRHRGPDETGRYAGPGIGLAIERLRIIDLFTGSQPIYNENKDVVVVFNGEIYNYLELRASLEAKGHVFSTKSDTETLVHLYEEHGEDLVHHLNGMFAFALYDIRRRRLVLARDPAGIKPLFYGEHAGRLRFGSELKAILTDPAFPREIDVEALHDYLSFYYVCAPRSIYRHIRRLPPGHRLIAENGRWRVEPYWDLRFVPDHKTSLGGWIEAFRSTLDASVARHLQSDVPVGLYLSGGLDSSSLAAFASRRVSKLSTYSVGYDEASYSELPEARRTAKLFSSDHHEFILRPGQVGELLPTVLAHLDEPHGDWSHLPNFLLAREVKKTATVVLTGTGGDELFGGYPTLLAARGAALYRRLPRWLTRGVLSPLVERLPVSSERMSLDFIARSFVRGADQAPEEAHRRFKEIFNADERAALVKPEFRGAFDPAGVFERLRPGFEGMDLLDRLMYLDFKVFMVDCGLYVNDITTSANAVEGRVPFLDREMIALAARVPWRWKLRGWTTKYLVREAMRRDLPPEIITMKKKGFLIPASPWLRAPLRPMVDEIVASASKELGFLLDFDVVRLLVDEHFEGRRDHTRRLTCLLSLFVWNAGAKPSWGRVAVGSGAA